MTEKMALKEKYLTCKINFAQTVEKKITEKMLGEFLYNPAVPSPDLIIRTSGEQRLSGFLLWQSAYSELYFTPKLWPDFSENDLDAALEEYANRKRRYGK